MTRRRSAIVRLFIGASAVVLLFQSGGCYYMQAISGHSDLMSRRQPVDEVIADEAVPEEIRVKLALVQEARDFAVTELLLPDNDSYRSYADLERDYVVWNVFAAPEFSLEPVTWCFPVAGCVAYRGYFDEEDARAKAEQMREDGFDVATGGIPAYSTLGRFDDPVLNTMMRWRDTDLVATIFHELAHQVLYVKDDTAFNESFATAVEEFADLPQLRGEAFLHPVGEHVAQHAGRGPAGGDALGLTAPRSLQRPCRRDAHVLVSTSCLRPALPFSAAPGSWVAVSSAASAANAAIDHMRSWALGTDGDDWDTDGKESIPELKKMMTFANRVGITIAEHTTSASHNTEVEKYLKKSALLEDKPDLLRLDVMQEDADEARLIEGIKKLISE